MEPAKSGKVRVTFQTTPHRTMPNKHNDKRRHHILKMKYRMTDWAEYDVGLRRRGSLTLCVTDVAMAGRHAAPRLISGGQSLLL